MTDDTETLEFHAHSLTIKNPAAPGPFRVALAIQDAEGNETLAEYITPNVRFSATPNWVDDEYQQTKTLSIELLAAHMIAEEEPRPLLARLREGLVRTTMGSRLYENVGRWMRF